MATWIEIAEVKAEITGDEMKLIRCPKYMKVRKSLRFMLFYAKSRSRIHRD